MNQRAMRWAGAAALVLVCGQAQGQQKLHFTYLWHLEQPIYWPERQASGYDRYERAWESIQHKNAGAAHPQDDLNGIFGLDDRRAVYQYRVKDCVSAISGSAEAGAQITYSGGLIENIMSLGGASQLGYSPSWNNDIRTARGWSTSASGTNKPRLDVVLFSFHHGMLPLLDDSAVRKEIQLYKRIYADAWGSAAPMSRGFFPSEMAFSDRLIPILANEGVAWTFVSSEKVSRACSDFPVVYGSGGINCDPPNKADQLNGAGTNYYRVSISRGCGPAEAVPRSYTPAYAQYTDPATGVVSKVIVVPASQSMGWKDGYAPLGLGDFNAVDAIARPSRPMLVVLAHDGDNAWGGGYSYYMEATPNLVSSAGGAGYTATVVEKYLADHAVPTSDVVYVEQGAWVNADGDFGSPQMLNWNWPLLNSSGQIDIDNGWHVDERNWAVITATNNRVETAEQIWKDAGGAVDLGHIVYPDNATNNAERAWHYFLGGVNSGFMYYGTALDMEIKPTVSGNRAVQYADAIIGAGSQDRTGPTVWAVQRHPWNPGSVNFGPQYGYKQYVSNGDFKVWTFVYDVSGVASVTLKYRLDNDGVRTIGSVDNETYAGGPGVGAWQSIAMTRRTFPAGNVYNDPSIDFSAMPAYIADQYTANVTGIRSKLVDYYVEAIDTRGNAKRSPISHVWVGDGSGSGGGGGSGSAAVISPNPAQAGQSLVVTYDPTGRNLAGSSTVKMHYGFNNWTPVISPDLAMTQSGGKWQTTISVPSDATQFDCVFNNGANTWDNNGGADWHFTVLGGVTNTWKMDGLRDADSTLVASNAGGAHLWAGLKGDVLYVATEASGDGNDRFLLLAKDAKALGGAMWAKAGLVSGWDCFLGDENSNSYSGWTGVPAGVTTQNAKSQNGGVIEGTVNLKQLYGTVPDSVRLAAVRYGSNDGAALVSGLQAPPSVNGDGNVDAAEYVSVNMCDFTHTCCPVDFNRDGFVDFYDFTDFVTCFESSVCPSGSSADFNNDGFVDFYDFTDFVTAFEIGC